MTGGGEAVTVDKDGKKTRLNKKEGVTKIGNNTYFYTGKKKGGPGESTEEEEEEEEEMDDEAALMTRADVGEEGDDGYDYEDGPGGEEEEHEEKVTPGKKPRPNRSYASGRRKHRTDYVYGAKSTAAKTRRCGECEGCNREDCGQCDNCKDKPKFGGKNSKKQACIYRLCTWKNPSGKKYSGRGRQPKHPTPGASEGTPVTPRLASTLIKNQDATPTSKRDPGSARQKLDMETPSPRPVGRPKRGRKSISVVSPAVPPIVKKGDDEYVVVVSGAKDTGLCGKYWGDAEALPSKRRRTTVADALKVRMAQINMH